MKNTNKKGFTIVELVIVVAVIAILAAVLIPTFSGIIAKANLSADQQAVRQMNTALAMYEAENGKPKNLTEAKKALDEALVNVESGLVPVTQGYAFYWDSANNKIILVSSEDEIKTGWHILTANSFGSLVKVETVAALKDAIANSSAQKPALIKLNADLALDDVINVEEGNVVTIDLNGKKLTTHVGAYTTLDNKASRAVIMVSEGATLNIEGGSVVIPEDGHRGIVNQCGSLTLRDVKIEGAPNKGCAVFVEGNSDTTIIDSEITVTSTTSFAVTSNSSVDASDGIRLSIVNSEIYYNSTVEGAAIYMPVSGNVSIENSKIVASEAAAHAVRINGCSLSVKDSTIEYKGVENGPDPSALYVLASGGGYSNYAKLTWENSTLIGSIYVSEPTNSTVVVSGIEVPAENWLKE